MNTYASGHNDHRKGCDNRMSEIAAAETERIIAIVREALLSEAAVDAAREAIEYRSVEPRAATSDQEAYDDALDALEAAWLTAFDADDTGTLRSGG